MKKLYVLVALFALTIGSVGMSDARSHRDKQQTESVAGVFDYYLLTLSWSPTFCLTHQNNPQCSGKGYGFVLHGLWPQYAKGGWPESCPPMVPLTSAEQKQGLTLFVTPKLLQHEWSKHGTCSGLGASGYLNVADKAVGAVKIPDKLKPLSTEIYFPAQEIAQMFRQSNPGIPEDGIAIVCSGPELSEVRVCLGKDLSFGSCGKGVKSQCRAGDIRVPPMR
ncbi:ribonuclease [Pseudomonas sp. NPDC087697]|uniref:ribonuclease T2 family protein n=1 Tax=Pseudomonas sp. NPDC087697 TaxID=3364447 RepID=UPI0037FC15E8